ncbi:MAG: hypothetical protein Q8L68_03025 [Methylococcales bacterium]|nr:hypothetical protein [Methylococcales bacterium]
MKLKKNDAIVVKWLDIVQEDTWQSEDSASKFNPIICHTLGFFLNEDKQLIRLSDSIASDGDRNVIVIPRGCILKIGRWDRVER